MNVTPNIFVSASHDRNLNIKQKEVKNALYEKLINHSLIPWGYGKAGQIKNNWNFEVANYAMMRCQGAVIVAFAQWSCKGLGPRAGKDDGFMPSEGNNLEGGLAIAHNVPMLVIIEKGVLPRGVLEYDSSEFMIEMDENISADWVINNNEFNDEFTKWSEKVKSRSLLIGKLSSIQEKNQEFDNAIKEIKKKWYDQIAKGGTKEALNDMKLYLNEKNNENAFVEVISFLSRLYVNEGQLRLGVTSNEDYNLENNKINRGILSIITEIN